MPVDALAARASAVLPAAFVFLCNDVFLAVLPTLFEQTGLRTPPAALSAGRKHDVPEHRDIGPSPATHTRRHHRENEGANE